MKKKENKKSLSPALPINREKFPKGEGDRNNKAEGLSTMEESLSNKTSCLSKREESLGNKTSRLSKKEESLSNKTSRLSKKEESKSNKAESFSTMAEGKGQRAEGKAQKAEGKGKKSEDRTPIAIAGKTEARSRGRRAESRVQRQKSQEPGDGIQPVTCNLSTCGNPELETRNPELVTRKNSTVFYNKRSNRVIIDFSHEELAIRACDLLRFFNN